MLALTEGAAATIEGILADPAIPEGSGLRIATTVPANDDDPAAAAELEVGLAVAPDADDEVIEERGARVFVEQTAAQLLDDKVLDADSTGDQVRFSLANQG